MAEGKRWRFAMVCSSNMNRSMEAHSQLGRAGLDVESYGTGTHVKLPGPSLHEPNVYDFGTPYGAIYDDLRRKDPELYKRNGLLPMLKRNTSVKLAPQRWQDNAGDGVFDMIMTFEERVFDLVVEDMNNREPRLMKCVLIINMDVKDNHEEAGVGAKLAVELCQKDLLLMVPMLEAIDGDWEDIIDDLITAFEKQHKRRLAYSISFY
ncbi:Ssu72-like family protein [Zea mays]|uniref:RNA polymerase II subunit A C-terminal domain phosphatase SSU72 n=1 Tax=Zea mays TaxID=4577 RepID=A0A1D6MYY7_MAIZE|nr:Ssu72-like family protein [Zea mays]